VGKASPSGNLKMHKDVCQYFVNRLLNFDEVLTS